MIEWLEVVWTALSLAGVILHVRGLWASWGDLRIIQRARANGARLLIVKGHLYHHAARIVVKLAFVAVGVIAMALPPPPPNHPVGVTAGMVTALIVANMALLWASAMDALHRRALIVWYRAQAQARAKREVEREA